VRVVVSGYYGYSNFGDEAILERLLSILRGSHADEITVLSGDPDKTRERFEVDSVALSSVAARARAIAAADRVVIGGGGLIKDTSAEGGLSAAVALLDVLFAVAKGTPTLVYAVGVGRIKDAVGWRHVTRILSLADDVVVRDILTWETLKARGVPVARLHLAADPLFALLPQASSEEGAHDLRRPRVGVSLSASDMTWARSHLPQQASNLPKQLAVELLRQCQQCGARVTLLALQDSPYGRDVDELHDLISALSQEVCVDLIEVAHVSPRQALTIMSTRIDFLIAMRFHALVLAVLSRVPFVAIGWDPKLRALASDLGVPNRAIDLACDDIATLGQRVTTAWSNPSDAPSEQRVQALRDRALAAERLLSEFVTQPRFSEPRRRAKAVIELSRLLVHFASKRLRRARSSSLRSRSRAARTFVGSGPRKSA
jgi:polysaccharide pyruvyl transferase CsaB